MRLAVDATLKKVPLKKFAEGHDELKQALEKWM
jgi:ribulose 1,5-bisphosphate carboxylase large subunit-like protein